MAPYIEVFPQEHIPHVKAVEKSIGLEAGDKMMCNLIPLCNQDCVKYVNEEWSWKKGDILIVSYPKTGTNWVAKFVQLLVNDTDEEAELVKNMPSPFFGIETAIPEKFMLLDMLPLRRRVFFTHLSADVLNKQKLKEAGVKVIYILRNPRDQMVSQYKFYEKLPMFQRKPFRQMVKNGWDTFFKHALNGDFPLDGKRDGAKSTYADHILSWLPTNEDDQIHLVYYENLQKDFYENFTQVARFLGVEVEKNRAEEIEDQCSIGSMRKEYEHKGGYIGKNVSTFVGKGGVCGWRNFFNQEQIDEMNQVFETKLNGSGIQFSYEVNRSS